jgi:cytochrome b subunit of formate dehydrogenase
MARFGTLLILLATFAWAGFAMKAGPGDLGSTTRRLGAEAKAALERLRGYRSLRAADLLASLRVSLLSLAAASVIVLAITGFVPYWIWGQHTSGFSLVLHVAVGPVFAVCVTALTVLWAHRQRFDARDMEWLRRRSSRGEEGEGGNEDDDIEAAATSSYSAAGKLTFWALVLLSPLVMGSIILRMYPVFSTPGHRALLTVHLLSGLLFVLVAVIQVVRLVNSSAK